MLVVWHAWPGNFPKKKTYMCAQTKRGNKGLRRARMGPDGCGGMHRYAANANQGKRSDFWGGT